MDEKMSVNDTLSCTNSIITLLEYTIEQCNNKNFRDTIVQTRNNLEDIQWELYLIAKQKGYYVPAAPAGQADIDQVKQSISK